MAEYRKLVRDKIPELIERQGERAIVETLSEERYRAELDRKLNEEIAEYQESKALEELADALEVIGAICAARGVTEAELQALRAAKRAERGGFERRRYLIAKEER